tara:strand:+ start:81 stop:416 length:336 start_codon:yes stop_codon:yes gene_type:complete
VVLVVMVAHMQGQPWGPTAALAVPLSTSLAQLQSSMPMALSLAAVAVAVVAVALITMGKRELHHKCRGRVVVVVLGILLAVVGQLGVPLHISPAHQQSVLVALLRLEGLVV